MFKESDQIEKFEPKVWLSSPTMHGEEFEFLKVETGNQGGSLILIYFRGGFSRCVE